MGLQGLTRARLLALLTPLTSGKRDDEKFISDIVGGAAVRPPFRHSIGTIPCWPFVFTQSAHPSSYSVNTWMVSPTIIGNSSGRLVMKEHITTAPAKGDRLAELGEYVGALNVAVLPPPLRDVLEFDAENGDIPL